MRIGRHLRGFAAAVVLAAVLPARSIGTAPGGSALSGTAWELVSIRSMDDAIGTTVIADPSLYTAHFGEDGQAAFRFNCNRARGSWEAKSAVADSGRLGFGPIAATRALCPPPSVDERVARDIGYVRSCLLRDGRLHMSMMADGGIYTRRRSTPQARQPHRGDPQKKNGSADRLPTRRVWSG